jgi:hypothetical protein
VAYYAKGNDLTKGVIESQPDLQAAARWEEVVKSGSTSSPSLGRASGRRRHVRGVRSGGSTGRPRDLTFGQRQYRKKWRPTRPGDLGGRDTVCTGKNYPGRDPICAWGLLALFHPDEAQTPGNPGRASSSRGRGLSLAASIGGPHSHRGRASTGAGPLSRALHRTSRPGRRGIDLYPRVTLYRRPSWEG